MASEPVLLPTYPAEVWPNRWYCFLCPQFRNDAHSVRIHMGAAHDLDNPTNGTDYGDGELVALLQLQRSVWERELPIHLARELDSLAGADDFIFEVGVGLPEPPCPPIERKPGA